MRKEIIAFISKELGYENLILIEKDMILNFLLYELNRHSSFKNKYIFKGGTCLIKSYFGYYRFSEDLDFTFADQELFSGLSETKIRKIISKEIYEFGNILEEVANKLELEFKLDKKDKKYCEFGGGGRFTSFKLWYRSSILNEIGFIKIQINYVDLILFPIVKSEIVLMNKSLDERIFIIFNELKYLKRNIFMNVYSPEEFCCEKIRSIITRRGVKIRDFIDLYYLYKSGVNYSNLENEIILKTRYMLRYEKYRKNLTKNLTDLVNFGEEKIISLEPIPKGFYNFSKKIINFCEKLKRIFNQEI